MSYKSPILLIFERILRAEQICSMSNKHPRALILSAFNCFKHLFFQTYAHCNCAMLYNPVQRGRLLINLGKYSEL